MEKANKFEIKVGKDWNYWDLTIYTQFLIKNDLVEKIDSMNGIVAIIPFTNKIYIGKTRLFTKSELKQNLTDLINAYLENTKQ